MSHVPEHVGAAEQAGGTGRTPAEVEARELQVGQDRVVSATSRLASRLRTHESAVTPRQAAIDRVRQATSNEACHTAMIDYRNRLLNTLADDAELVTEMSTALGHDGSDYVKGFTDGCAVVIEFLRRVGSP